MILFVLGTDLGAVLTPSFNILRHESYIYLIHIYNSKHNALREKIEKENATTNIQWVKQS